MKMNINGAQSGPELCLFANYLPPPPPTKCYQPLNKCQLISWFKLCEGQKLIWIS